MMGYDSFRLFPFDNGFEGLVVIHHVFTGITGYKLIAIATAEAQARNIDRSEYWSDRQSRVFWPYLDPSRRFGVRWPDGDGQATTPVLLSQIVKHFTTKARHFIDFLTLRAGLISSRAFVSSTSFTNPRFEPQLRSS